MIPQLRQLLVVRDCEENRGNDFWRPLIGKAGVVSDVEPDGLINVVILQRHEDVAIIPNVKQLSQLLTRFDLGGCTFSFGVKPQRFDFGAVLPDSQRQRRWWQFWKRA